MVKFTAKEEAFLKANEVCRLATASKDGIPQVTPVMYVMDGPGFVIAVDYGTKKLKNVKENPNVALWWTSSARQERRRSRVYARYMRGVRNICGYRTC